VSRPLRVVVTALTCWIALAAPALAARPNVLVIETDDQTAESIRAMPNVQHLIADQGATFDNSFVSYSLCCPSRATFLTGQYPHNHGVLDNVPPYGGFYRLDSSSTLPVWLKDAGYRTILVGKYLNGYGSRDPTLVPPGWDDWHGLIARSTYRYYGFKMNENGSVVRYPNTPRYYQTDVLARKAVQLLSTTTTDTKPFFMWLPFVAPHFSFDPQREPDDPPPAITRTPVPAPRDRNRFAGEPLPRSPAFDESDVSDKPDTVRHLPRITPRVRAAIRENYQQELESLQAVDRAVGEIVAQLERTGALDRTLIVFTSDNGYFHGEHRLVREKILPYEPSIRVPLVIRGPGIPAGLHLDQLVSNQDLAPTILDAAGVRPGLVEDGESVLPLIDNPHDEPGRDLLVEGIYRRRTTRTIAFTAVRSRHWFYAEYTSGQRELYDLTADPDELVNRDLDPHYAGIEADLAIRLARLRNCRGDTCREHPRIGAVVSYDNPTTSTCASSDVEVRVRGPESSEVTHLDVYAGSERVASAPGRAVTVPRSSLPGGNVVLRPTAYLADDRAFTMAGNVTMCGSAAALPVPVAPR
jgi:N-acetylglucosamine-6-sulfatase